MLLNLRPIAGIPGSSIPFSFSLDLSELEINCHFPANAPVLVSGEVLNRAGALELRARAHTVLNLFCDRCIRPFTQDWQIDIVEPMSENENVQNYDESIPIVNDSIDLAGIVRSAFILDMELKWLCSDDCRGLCFTCGQNLNEGKCDCSEHSADPRFHILGAICK